MICTDLRKSSIFSGKTWIVLSDRNRVFIMNLTSATPRTQPKPNTNKMTEATLISPDEAAAIEAKKRADRTEDETSALKAFKKAQRTAEKAAKKDALKPFRANCSTDLLNSDSLLTTHVLPDYDTEVHLPLKKEDFAGEDNFMRFRAEQIRVRGEAMVAKAAEMMKEADQLQQLGDPATRKAMKTANKLIANLGKLKASLAASGVNIDEMLSDL